MLILKAISLKADIDMEVRAHANFINSYKLNSFNFEYLKSIIH